MTFACDDKRRLPFPSTSDSSQRNRYSHWLQDVCTPLPRPVFTSLPPFSRATLDSSYRRETIQRMAREPNDADIFVVSTDTQPRQNPTSGSDISSPAHRENGPNSKTAEEPPQSNRMDTSACFQIIVNQVTQLAHTSQIRTETPDSTLPNELTPLQHPNTIDPTTWPIHHKWIYTILVGLTMFNGSFASTAPNGSGPHMVQQFGLSNEEMVFIATSFVGGCVAGPIVWAPLSEIYGRRITFLTSMLFYTITNIGCALAPTKAVLFACRFVDGVFASSAFSNAAALITDLFSPVDRAKPMIVASLAPLLGPCFGPLFGAGVSSKLRWPFVFWLLGAIGLVLQVVLFFLPETYAPVIARRCKPKEAVVAKVSWRTKARNFVVLNLGRPLNMMLREPIVMCANFYLSFFFALMYIFFASWPLIFGPPGIYRLDAVHTGITFLPMGFGGIVAALLLPLCQRYYIKRSKAAGHPVPEARLLPTFFVAPLVAVGLLWAGWFGRKSIPYQITMLAGIPIGAAMVLVFQGWIGYLGDCYRLFSSSAIAATVIGRSLSGATIPLCTHRLHEKLGGIAYLYTMLAGLVILTIPIPYLVFRYGDRLRSRSMYKPGRA